MKLSRLLISNTSMKLLTTIAAVLISISAFSQDLIEYKNGTFTQNGEELSMEQINDLTVLHKAGRDNVSRGINFDEMHKNAYLRSVNNSVRFVGATAGTYFGGYSVFYGLIFTELEVNFIGVPMIAVGTGFCVVSFKAISRITFQKGCLRRRDRQFNKVADKINQAIAAANQ